MANLFSPAAAEYIAGRASGRISCPPVDLNEVPQVVTTPGASGPRAGIPTSALQFVESLPVPVKSFRVRGVVRNFRVEGSAFLLLQNRQFLPLPFNFQLLGGEACNRLNRFAERLVPVLSLNILADTSLPRHFVHALRRRCVHDGGSSTWGVGVASFSVNRAFVGWLRAAHVFANQRYRYQCQHSVRVLHSSSLVFVGGV